MSAIANIPMTVTTEADAYIDEVGKRKTYERLLEHIPVHYQNVKSVEVSFQPDYEFGEDHRVIIEVMRDDPGFDDQADWQWDKWKNENIAPEDYGYFCVWSLRV